VETRGKIKKPIFPPFPTSLKNSPRNAASFSQFPQLLRLLEEKKGKTTKLVLTFLGLLMEATLSAGDQWELARDVVFLAVPQCEKPTRCEKRSAWLPVKQGLSSYDILLSGEFA